MKNLVFAISLIVSFSAFAESFREEVRGVMKGNLPSISACYSEALKKDASLKGRLVLDWDITDQGAATNVKVKFTDIKSEEIINCVKDHISKFKFPSAPVKSVANINYPFAFGR